MRLWLWIARLGSLISLLLPFLSFNGIRAHAANPVHEPLSLAMKFVEYADGAGSPILKLEEINDILGKVNRIYSVCSIRFIAEEILAVQPEQHGLRYNTNAMNQLGKIRSPFDSKKHLVVIHTGPWDHKSMGNPNAWTTMPGSKPSGAVIEATVAKDPNMLAHELGHYLGLNHVNDSDDLMNPIIYQKSIRLEPWQCDEMRKTAKATRADAIRTE